MCINDFLFNSFHVDHFGFVIVYLGTLNLKGIELLVLLRQLEKMDVYLGCFLDRCLYFTENLTNYYGCVMVSFVVPRDCFKTVCLARVSLAAPRASNALSIKRC